MSGLPLKHALLPSPYTAVAPEVVDSHSAVRQARRNHITVEVGRRPQVLGKPALVADLDQRVCVPIKFHVVAIDTGCVVGARGVVVHGIGVVAAVAIAEGATAVVDVGLRVVIAGRLVDAAGEETTTVIAACKRVEVHSQRVVAPGKDAGHAPAYGFGVVVAGRRIQTGRIAARAAAIVTSRIGVVIAEAGVRAPGVGATAVVVCCGLAVVAGAFVRAAQHFEGVAHAVAIGIGQARAIAIQFWFRVHATAIGVGHQGAEVASCRIVATETGVEIAAAVVQCCAGIVVTGRLVGAARQAVVIANAVAIEVGCAAAATGTHCVFGIACTIARPFGNVLATAVVDGAGTIAHAASVVVAHAIVHVVAEAVAIGIGCTTATTDAECIELVAGAIAISGSDSSAATVVDGARAVADAAVVGLPHAIVVAVVIADAVAIRVLQTGAATHVEGVELVAFAVAISLGKGGAAAFLHRSRTAAHTAIVPILATAVLDRGACVVAGRRIGTARHELDAQQFWGQRGPGRRGSLEQQGITGLAGGNKRPFGAVPVQHLAGRSAGQHGDGDGVAGGVARGFLQCSDVFGQGLSVDRDFTRGEIVAKQGEESEQVTGANGAVLVHVRVVGRDNGLRRQAESGAQEESQQADSGHAHNFGKIAPHDNGVGGRFVGARSSLVDRTTPTS